MPALLANCDVDDGRSCAAFTGEDAGSSGMGFHSTGAGSEEVLQLINQSMLEFQVTLPLPFLSHTSSPSHTSFLHIIYLNKYLNLPYLT